MTVRERVLTSRLIQKIDHNENYARQIGLGYKMTMAGTTQTTVVGLGKINKAFDKGGEKSDRSWS